MSGRIYFDHSATTPVDPRVLNAMMPFLEGCFGNPSSMHREGRKAREAVEAARAQVAALLGADAAEIVFTGSGTEADNLALLGVRPPAEKGHIVTSSIEHAAVLETCRYLERRGIALTYLPVDQEGIIDPSDVQAALRPDTYLVSVMAANNVVGTIQPIDELARITKQHGALFHTDAVQAAGKIPLDVSRCPVDLIALSAHKLHGPKGIGALYVRSGVELSPMVFGGGQERGRRSATENVAGIVGFGMAAELARQGMQGESLRLAALRQHLLHGLQAAVPGLYLIGDPDQRLHGHLSVGITGHESEVGAFLKVLDDCGVAVSAGSACSAHQAGAPSSVLLAMGFDPERARGLIRITLGRFSTRDEVDRAVAVFADAAAQLWPTAQSRPHRIATEVFAN